MFNFPKVNYKYICKLHFLKILNINLWPLIEIQISPACELPQHQNGIYPCNPLIAETHI